MHEIPNSPQSQNLHPLKEKSPNHPRDPHKPKPPTKHNAHPNSSLGGSRNNIKFATPPCDEARPTPNLHQTSQGILAHEDPQNDQRPLPQAKYKSQNHVEHGTPCQTPIPDPRCFLCFSKESKTNFPKQFIIDYISPPVYIYIYLLV